MHNLRNRKNKYSKSSDGQMEKATFSTPGYSKKYFLTNVKEHENTQARLPLSCVCTLICVCYKCSLYFM